MEQLIIREEIFGATIFNCNNGKKIYIDAKELKEFYKNNIFPKDLGLTNYSVKSVIKLNGHEQNDKFSFCDIVYIELTFASIDNSFTYIRNNKIN